ncbi:hypothetical protein B0F90DRAFT_1668591 [Multifurca ochricompacta]|uniref:TFIIS N-terminal domain-containing protein n=1 Tax=Multifurca ochricompacta TaxID=376703 RepID=A0AAD4QMY8_9AGAM|nr:hypothetical protein B0F90DRAFT_1668591 [Multifurca ochricompacta]
MDVFSNTSGWLQHSPTQVARSSQVVVQNDLADSQRPPNSTDWKDPSPSSASGSNGAPSVSGNIDLHDFGLGDLSAPQTSSTSLTTSSSFFNYPNNFFLPSVPAPYNGITYGTSSWSPQPGQVPLSTYSTLNGATSTTSPQSPPSQSSQPNIEFASPALTTLSTSSPPLSYSSPTTVSQQQAPQHHLSLHSQYPQLSSLSIAYTQASPSPLTSNLSQATQTQTHPQSQQSQPSQGTLSPFALHAPQHLSSIPPSSFYTATTQSDSLVLPSQSRREAFLNSIKPSLQTKSFSGGARSVQQLVSRIVEYGISDVNPQTRLDILTKIRDNAGNNYFRAWLENISAMDITRDWLRAGATINADDQVLETIMPLLHIADRLPFMGETLVSSKIGKIVRKLAKDAPMPAVKDMAANLERKWRNQFVFMQDQVMPTDDDTHDAKQKKRKLLDAPSKAGPPAKKSALSAASSSRPTVTVKKEGRPSTATTVTVVGATVKESKSDSSFFSTPKQKPKLPSFKKAPAGATPVATRKEPPANVAQPSSTDAFQEALKDMARARRPSPAAPNTSGNGAAAAAALSAVSGIKPLKKKKSVTWAPDGQLELVKLIERAVYDDDPVDGTPHALHNVRELDRGEGAALHAHLFEELLDWSEPQPIDMPEDIGARPRGEDSQERGAQEQRELTALGASYLAQPIPDSPADLPPVLILSQEQVDENVINMLAGAAIDAISWPTPMTVGSLTSASVSELVGQLAAEGAGTSLTAPDMAPAPTFDPTLLAQLASSIPQEQLQQLAQMFATQHQQQQQQEQEQQQQQSSQSQGDQQDWDGQTPVFPADGTDASGAPRDRWPPAPDEPRWGGGTGRGRGRGRPLDGIRQFRSRIPCSFYAQGRQAHIPTHAPVPPLLSAGGVKELMRNLMSKQMQVR